MRTLLVLMMFIFVSTNVSATTARSIALGDDEIDKNGDYYLEDNRNIFLNPAAIHKHANQAIFEWGNKGTTTAPTSNFSGAGTSFISMGSRVTLPGASAPKANGGFIKKHGEFVYGVYLGNESTTSQMLRILSSSKAAVDGGPVSGTVKSSQVLAGPDNQVDFFFGGKSNDYDWAFNVLYYKDNESMPGGGDRATHRADGVAIRIGTMAKKWQFHANVSLRARSKSTVIATGTSFATGAYTGAAFTHNFEGSLGIHSGFSYDVTDSLTAFTYVRTFKWDQMDTAEYDEFTNPVTGQGDGQFGGVEGSFSTYVVGVGHKHKTDAGMLFGKAYYKNQKIDVKFTTAAEVKKWQVPVVLGYEVAATDWLVLRGSVKQVLHGVHSGKNYSSLNILAQQLAIDNFGEDTDGRDSAIKNSTSVAAGATLNFGNLAIDGVIGTNGTNGTVSGTNNGVFDLDRLMSRVAMTYKF
jgi:hypothetical protein